MILLETSEYSFLGIDGKEKLTFLLSSRMNYQTYETIDVQKEQEFWNNIIDRTTQ